MRATKLLSGAVLTAALGGCASNGPEFLTSEDALSRSDYEAAQIKEPKATLPAKPKLNTSTNALPERAAPTKKLRERAVPVETPTAPSSVVYAAPAPNYSSVPLQPAPRISQSLELIDTGPLDAVATVQPVQPPPVDLGPLNAPVALNAPAPSFVDIAQSPQYVPVGRAPVSVAYGPTQLSGATFTAPRSRATMQPIYDALDGSGDPSERRIHARKDFNPARVRAAGGPPPRIRSNFTPAFGGELERAALARLNPRIRYDARYVKIGYPWGDVPEATGVCSDVIIRSYRTLGIDLQQMLHEDMRYAFNAYPSRRIYGLRKPDPNIDHRRVVNLEAFFERTGASIPVGRSPADYQPGDVVTWRLSGNEPHIGIVVAERDPRSGYPLVVHNLGDGVQKQDLLSFQTPVGHYRFAPDRGSQYAQAHANRTLPEGG